MTTQELIVEVTLTRDCYVDGKPCKKGQTVDTKQAGLLIGAGQAIEVSAKKALTKKSPANRQAEPDETR
jgi:hypothetical protein